MAWEHRVIAFNTATESTNRMHDDEVARTFGFRGGLVPGVDVWAYLTRPCLDRWGTEFLTGSTMTVQFASPVYDGEDVLARLDDDGSLSLLGPDGTERARGVTNVDPLPPTGIPPEVARPDPVPVASPTLLSAGTALATLRFTFRREVGAAYLGEVRETSELYGGGAIAHPGFLARQANSVLTQTVRLGPWIHVGTTAQHRGLVHDGDEIEVRGVVVDEREHKGHRFVDLDVVVLAEGNVVWSASHTAIWQPRVRR